METITFTDNIGGGKLTLFHRLPTSEERIEYANSYVSRNGRKIKSAIGEARQKFGEKILTGISDGEWQKEDKTPLSSNPESPAYDPQWKNLVKKYAPDVIAMLCLHVFDNPLTIDMSDDEEDPT